MNRIRVLILHRDRKIRDKLSQKISALEDVKVISILSDVEAIFEKVEEKNPDIILIGMDFNRFSGLDILDKLMKSNPIPVLSISDHKKSEAVNSLSYGAIDLINSDYKSKEIHSLLKVAEKAQDRRYIKNSKVENYSVLDEHEVLLLAGSTGAQGALEFIVKNLPDNISVPIVVVQHISEELSRPLSKRLDVLSELNVYLARNEVEIGDGNIYVIPGNRDLTFKDDGGSKKISLNKADGKTPSIDKAFTSASEVYGSKSISVVLSGMGKDGALGSRYLSSKGAKVIVQDRKSCDVFGLGKHVINQGDADRVVNLEKLPKAIMEAL